MVCVSDGIIQYTLSLYQMAFGLFIWWHLFSIPRSIGLYIWLHLFSIIGSIWSVCLMAFIQYTWQYLVCICGGIWFLYQMALGVYILGHLVFITEGINFVLHIWWNLFSIPSSIWSISDGIWSYIRWHLVCISDGIYSVYMAAFGLSFWWHLTCIWDSIWSVYLMAFIQDIKLSIFRIAFIWQYVVCISHVIYLL